MLRPSGRFSFVNDYKEVFFLKKTRFLTVTAMLSAMAFVLQLIGTLIGIKVGGFLDVEFSDLPAIIGTLALGPFCGVAVEFIKNLLHAPFTTTGFIGECANFVVNGAFVLLLGLVYRRNKTKTQAIWGFVSATIAGTFFAILVNFFVMLPFYMPDMDATARLSLVLFPITPFNLAKGVVLSLITLLIYKKLSPFLKGTAH